MPNQAATLEKRITRILLLDNSETSLANVAGFKREVSYLGRDQSDDAHRFSWRSPFTDFRSDAFALPGSIYLAEVKGGLEKLFQSSQAEIIIAKDADHAIQRISDGGIDLALLSTEVGKISDSRSHALIDRLRVRKSPHDAETLYNFICAINSAHGRTTKIIITPYGQHLLTGLTPPDLLAGSGYTEGKYPCWVYDAESNPNVEVVPKHYEAGEVLGAVRKLLRMVFQRTSLLNTLVSLGDGFTPFMCLPQL